MTHVEPEDLSQQLRQAIRQEAFSQVAKGVVAGVIALVIFALAGWWLYFLPMLKGIVGGVPPSAVVAFDDSNLTSNSCPPGWHPFKEALGRSIIGAGSTSEAPDGMTKDSTGRILIGSSFRGYGGEEFHQLTPAELPSYSPRVITTKGEPVDLRITDVVPCLDGGCNQMGALTAGYRSGQHTNVPVSIEAIGSDQAHSVRSPYLALFYCKKDS